jgi:translation initiation factor 2 alpha subunit (eIF-2alpha)
MRFYKNETPNVDDIVMCHVERIQEYCIYVKLLGYDNVEGMVQLADASTRRKRRSVCLLKVNRKYPLLVIRIDEKNKYIDLSNKFLSKEDKESATERYNNYHFVIKTFKKFLSKKFGGKYEENTYLEYANKSIWKIQQKKCYKYLVHNYLNNNNFDEFDLNQEEKDIFKSILHGSFGDIIFKSTLNFMARNANFEGITKLKEIYSKIKENYDISVMIDVSPNYYLSVESNDSQDSLNKITEIEQYICNLMSEKSCLYKKIDVVTTNSLD